MSAERAGQHRGDQAHRLAGVVLALGAELVELDEAGEADDDQEDDDEDRDQPPEQRLGGEQALVGGAGQEPGVAGDGGASRQPEPGQQKSLRDRRLDRLCPRHARPPFARAILRYLQRLSGYATPRITAFESSRIGLSSKKWLTTIDAAASPQATGGAGSRCDPLQASVRLMMSRVSGERSARRGDPAERRLGLRAAAGLERPPGAEVDEEPRRGLRIAAVEVEDEVGDEIVAGAVGRG